MSNDTANATPPPPRSLWALSPGGWFRQLSVPGIRTYLSEGEDPSSPQPSAGRYGAMIRSSILPASSNKQIRRYADGDSADLPTFWRTGLILFYTGRNSFCLRQMLKICLRRPLSSPKANVQIRPWTPSGPEALDCPLILRWTRIISLDRLLAPLPNPRVIRHKDECCRDAWGIIYPPRAQEVGGFILSVSGGIHDCIFFAITRYGIPVPCRFLFSYNNLTLIQSWYIRLDYYIPIYITLIATWLFATWSISMSLDESRASSNKEKGGVRIKIFILYSRNIISAI